MHGLINMNGAIVPPDRAFVSVFDRGFLYGDSVYEVCRTYRGEPFELEAHLERLEASAAKIGMVLPIPPAEIAQRIALTLEAASLPGEAYVRIIVTRGAGEIALDPAAAVDPNVIILVKPLTSPPADAYSRGVKVEIVGVRRNARDALDPAAKTGNYLNSVLAMAEAKKAAAHEAIFLDRNGTVAEGASSTIFLVKAGVLITPALEVGILPGITRKVVLGLARSLGIRSEERVVQPEELEHADEAFLASTIREVLPISSVGANALTAPGPVTRKLLDAFRKHTGNAA